MSLLLAEPRTGRTHQIRSHVSHIGHPIALWLFRRPSSSSPCPSEEDGKETGTCGRWKGRRDNRWYSI